VQVGDERQGERVPVGEPERGGVRGRGHGASRKIFLTFPVREVPKGHGAQNGLPPGRLRPGHRRGLAPRRNDEYVLRNFWQQNVAQPRRHVAQNLERVYEQDAAPIDRSQIRQRVRGSGQFQGGPQGVEEGVGGRPDVSRVQRKRWDIHPVALRGEGLEQGGFADPAGAVQVEKTERQPGRQKGRPQQVALGLTPHELFAAGGGNALTDPEAPSGFVSRDSPVRICCHC
jgi:hypothetical protein